MGSSLVVKSGENIIYFNTEEIKCFDKQKKAGRRKLPALQTVQKPAQSTFSEGGDV